MIVSVGYEGRDLDSFVRLLLLHGVRELVDVRLTPSSRKPGFSKTRLEETLADLDIGYRHMRTLGNPRSNREGFRAGRESARRRYRSKLDNGSRAAVEEIIQVSRNSGPVAVLCYERDQARCHRHIITQLAQEIDPGLVVVPVE